MSEENKNINTEAVALTDEALGEVAGGVMIDVAGKRPIKKLQNGRMVRLKSGEPFTCSTCLQKVGSSDVRQGLVLCDYYVEGKPIAYKGEWVFIIRCVSCGDFLHGTGCEAYVYKSGNSRWVFPERLLELS